MINFEDKQNSSRKLIYGSLMHARSMDIRNNSVFVHVKQIFYRRPRQTLKSIKLFGEYQDAINIYELILRGTKLKTKTIA